MSGGQTKIFNVLGDCPWWVSVIIACTAYIGLSFVLQNIQTDNKILALVQSSATLMAPLLVFLLFILGLYAYIALRKKRRQLAIQTSIEGLKSLSWETLQELVSEAYRKQGYSVVEHEFGPDDCVDIMLVKSKKIALVRCKQWHCKNVGVSVVREMFAVLTAQKAAKMIIISLGGFTSDAQEFAENKPIDLVGGTKLLEMLGEVQSSSTIEHVINPSCSSQ